MMKQRVFFEQASFSIHSSPRCAQSAGSARYTPADPLVKTSPPDLVDEEWRRRLLV